jgi:hypothetical protein
VGRSQSGLVDQILSAWLVKNGKGKEMFDRPDSDSDADLDDRLEGRNEMNLNGSDEAA